MAVLQALAQGSSQVADIFFVYGRRSLLVPRGRFASVEVREVKGFAARADGSTSRVVNLPRGAARA